jgi:hypothetical protein
MHQEKDVTGKDGGFFQPHKAVKINRTRANRLQHADTNNFSEMPNKGLESTR